VAQLKASNEKLAAMAAEMEALEKVVTQIQEKEGAGVRTAAEKFVLTYSETFSPMNASNPKNAALNGRRCRPRH
jgi:hypothetical protein